MNVLLDTNVLGRMAEPAHPQCQVAHDAADAIRRRGDVPCLVPQILYELWVVVTRPAAQNGFGLTPQQAEAELNRIEKLFPLIADTAAIYSEWKRLVTGHQVTGKNAHDARVVAAMIVHGITHILTFNTADFARYPGITAVEPSSVLLPASP